MGNTQRHGEHDSLLAVNVALLRINREAFFYKHYHKRSNVESTFSMIKKKFGSSVRAKTSVAQVNEVLCKVLCHNICLY